MIYSFDMEDGGVLLISSSTDRDTMARMCNEYLGNDEIDHADIDFVQYLNDAGIQAEWVETVSLEWSTGNEYPS